MEVIERTAGHYEVQELPFGRAYHWAPEHTILECDCGKRLSLSTTKTICPWCGTDWAGVVQLAEEEEVVGHQLLGGDEVLHPWRYWHSKDYEGIPV
jgi:hypothetical protein